MSINVEWDDAERTAVRFEIDGDWNWDELNWANVQARRLLDSSDHKANLIFDLQHGNWLPRGHLRRSRILAADAHPNCTGRAVLVGVDEFTSTFESLLRKTYGFTRESRARTVFYAHTLNEARTILAASYN